jgi:hypothetical protein
MPRASGIGCNDTLIVAFTSSSLSKYFKIYSIASSLAFLSWFWKKKFLVSLFLLSAHLFCQQILEA